MTKHYVYTYARASVFIGSSIYCVIICVRIYCVKGAKV